MNLIGEYDIEKKLFNDPENFDLPFKNQTLDSKR